MSSFLQQRCSVCYVEAYLLIFNPLCIRTCDVIVVFLKDFLDGGFVQVDTEKRHEEQRKFGVFFDDDYDYLQHLKEPSGQSELVAAVSSNRDGGSVQFLNEGDDEMEQEDDSPVS